MAVPPRSKAGLSKEGQTEVRPYTALKIGERGGVRLVHSRLELATRFGSRGPTFLRGRRHNGSHEHELPTRRDECSLARRNQLQRSSKNFPEEHAQYPTR